MKSFFRLVIISLVLPSCGSDHSEKLENLKKVPSFASQYSQEFLNHFEAIEAVLNGDSILLPSSAGCEVLQIPGLIMRNEEYTFATGSGNSISIRKINYTDLEFKILIENQEFKGTASLEANFYLGTETISFVDGEYVINYYTVYDSNNPCIKSIGLGNQNIVHEESEEVYAVLVTRGDTCKDEFYGFANKRLKRNTALNQEN